MEAYPLNVELVYHRHGVWSASQRVMTSHTCLCAHTPWHYKRGWQLCCGHSNYGRQKCPCYSRTLCFRLSGLSPVPPSTACPNLRPSRRPPPCTAPQQQHADHDVNGDDYNNYKNYNDNTTFIYGHLRHK